MLNYQVCVTFGLLNDTGLSGIARLRNVKVEGDTRLCIALASNRSKSMLRLPPQEKIDKLKVLLGMDESPQWYEYSG